MIAVDLLVDFGEVFVRVGGGGSRSDVIATESRNVGQREILIHGLGNAGEAALRNDVIRKLLAGAGRISGQRVENAFRIIGKIAPPHFVRGDRSGSSLLLGGITETRVVEVEKGLVPAVVELGDVDW